MESESGEDGKCVGVRCAIAQGVSYGVKIQGTTIIRAREKSMVRRCGACHITARHRMDMHCDIRGAHGDNCEAQCDTAVRKKPRFTHIRGNLRGDVSENVLVRAPWKETWLELERASVETTKG